MPKQKKFKQRVRARQDKTGQSYMDARRSEESNKTHTPAWEEREMLLDEARAEWLKKHPGPHEVTIKLDYNEHGTPFAEVSGPGFETFTVTQPSRAIRDVLIEAERTSRWIREDPRDDLGDLPAC